MQAVSRGLAIGVAAAAIAALAVQAAVLLDLYQFEYAELLKLLGARGLTVALVLNAGLLIILVRVIRPSMGRGGKARLGATLIVGFATLTLLWVLDWTFLEKPISVRLQLLLSNPRAVALNAPWRQDFGKFSIIGQRLPPHSRRALETAYARIVINNAAAYSQNPPGSTIDRHAAQHEIDPELLFTILYLDSFYGEATSGPVPFLRNMTSETIRDLIQVHLPGWFVESRIRQSLVTSPLLVKLFGNSLGFKLRYAFQKANIDVSTQPYGANTLTNVFLVLKKYPEHFSDILDARNSDPVQAALRDSFLKLRDTALLPPYESPYDHAAYPPTYYTENREYLKQFSRAAFYLTALNFDFATRIEALLLSYRRDVYRDKIGPELWSQLPRWQQNAMLSMVQDVYTPSVGRLGYNLYALPEINNMALDFVADEAAKDHAKLGPRQEKLWRPQRYEALWGGAGFQLAVMNEIWSAVNPEPIPGVGVADSLSYAKDIVWLARRRLDGCADEGR